MNTRENKGITLIALVITIIVLLMISGISITGSINGKRETEEATQLAELSIIQHAILERYTKAQLTKEALPGTKIDINEVKKIIEEINKLSEKEIELKGNESEYKELNEADLKNLGISKEQDVFIVNYNTGEVINKTRKVTRSGKALYTYSKTDI